MGATKQDFASASAFAPAKINLFLHIGKLQPDGYHPVVSLIVFAGVGDTVRLSEAAAMEFGVHGPFAAGLREEGDNLVTRARDALLAASGARPSPFRLDLDKLLPIASGLGGGSADAAAALRLVRGRLGQTGLPSPSASVLTEVARGLGADVAACLGSSSVLATGRGDIMAPAPPMPPLDAVLVNPLQPSPTGAVYRAFDAHGATPPLEPPGLPPAWKTVDEVVGYLRRTRNDLEAPAVGLQPRIGEVLAALANQPESLLTRMSGSGATCFALCATQDSARTLAGRLARVHPDWWVRPCRFAAQGLRNR